MENSTYAKWKSNSIEKENSISANLAKKEDWIGANWKSNLVKKEDWTNANWRSNSTKHYTLWINIGSNFWCLKINFNLIMFPISLSSKEYIQFFSQWFSKPFLPNFN